MKEVQLILSADLLLLTQACSLPPVNAIFNFSLLWRLDEKQKKSTDNEEDCGVGISLVDTNYSERYFTARDQHYGCISQPHAYNWGSAFAI